MPTLYAGQKGQDFKLASGGLPKVNRGSGGLTPVLLPVGGGGYSAPKINIHSADVRYTPMPIAQNEIDTTLEAASDFASKWVGAAFDYQERENKIISTNAVAEYDSYARQQYNGGVDADGQDVTGYISSEGLSSKPAYMQLNEQLLQRRDEILKNISPGARQMAALSMQNSYNNAMGKAATHRAKQMVVADQDAKANEGHNILEEYEVDPNRAWGMSTEHANSFENMDERNTVLTEHMSHGMKTLMRQNLEAGGPMAEANAMKAMTEFFDSKREKLPTEVELEIYSELQVTSKKLENAQKARLEETLEYNKSATEVTAPTDIALLMGKGDMGILALDTQVNQKVRALYAMDAPAKGEEELTKYYQDAIAMQLMGPGTYQDAVDAWNNVKRGIASGAVTIGSGSMIKNIQKYVDGPLRSEAANKNVGQNNGVYSAISRKVFNLKDPKDISKFRQGIYEDPNMKKEYRDHALGVLKVKEAQMKGEIEAAQEQGWLAEYLTLLDEAEGGNTQEFKRKVHKLEGLGRLKGEYSDNLFAIADTFSAGKMPPEYKTLKTSVETTYDPKKMFYDPETGEVGFKNLQSSDRMIEVNYNISRLANKSPKALAILAKQSMMREARRWVNEPGSSGRNYDQWLSEVFLQKESVKASMALRVVTHTVDTLLPFPPEIKAELLKNKEEARLYDWGGGQQVGEAVPQGTGVQTVTPPVEEPTSPIAKLQPTTIPEKARLTIAKLPPNLQTRYQDKNTEFLTAIEFLRQGDRPNIDRLTDEQQEAAVDGITKTGKYNSWVKNF